MPYHPDDEVAQSIGSEFGLAVQTPPRGRRGWHYPGLTYCYAFVRPGTEVRWLSEQLQDNRSAV
jgi:hypothetical protein